MEIDGLTKRQVELLDEMWAIDSYSDYMEWKEKQPNLREIETLEELVYLAEIDDMVLTKGISPETTNYLTKFK